MLGKGWFPATVDGLDRYYRSLFEELPEASGVVVGPAEDAPPEVRVVAGSHVALPDRLLRLWLASQRRAHGCDVVDAHFALYAAGPLHVGRLRGRPTVFHFHGPWADENVSAGDTSRLKFALRHALERRTLRKADAIVVLSGAFRRMLVERYGIPPWDLHVIAPGVALGTFSPGDRGEARTRLGLDSTAFVVVCTRRLVPRMGIGVLLDAWAELDGLVPDGSTMLIVGEGPLRDDIAQRAQAPGLADRVRVLGRVSDDALVDVYRAADIAAVPSVAFEGFGLVVLEAAACGTPSLVSEAGGLPEAVHDLDPGLVVSSQDVRAWTSRLQRAVAGEVPSRATTRSFAERFDWPSVAERHRALYRRVVARKTDERLRVVYVDHVGRLSGAEIALTRLLPHLSDVNAHVILGEDGPLVTRLQTAGISVEVLTLAEHARTFRKDSVGPRGVSPLTIVQTACIPSALPGDYASCAPILSTRTP